MICPDCSTFHAILLESNEAWIAPTVEVAEVGTCARTDGGWVCDCGTLIPDAEIAAEVAAGLEDAALAAAGV